MSKYAFTLNYNGKNYHGWQVQPNATTVQGTLENALSLILREKIAIIGAGRTDTGVHASFYVANFTTGKKIDNLPQLTHKLNGFLPADISVFEIFEVPENFNSRFDAVSRTYHYYISRIKTPFFTNISLYYRLNLDIEKMNEACKILFDYEDFKSFEKLHSDNKTSLCKLYKANWKASDTMYVFEIEANRFLRNMVRSIVGTMIEIGRNKISLTDFRVIIESKNRSNAGFSVKPNGLFLSDIQYPDAINQKLEKSRILSKIILTK